MNHPPFVDVKFYPGYSYSVPGQSTSFGAARYVGLTSDGQVYVKMALDGAVWEKI